ncbi:Bcr/CflA family multidrug efflux MFS transporter [Acidihalobacter ferrooxydans]|uniref:Bcr/CflA family efflux transporter n=1 Tax=Acidihalobacter ferrooxydans TaxID=1765967 RepID=A0A1P8UJC3_9GAMM|nr:Bcr/CflA family multidrug efflux MFS transporter [Acidihalobacter ferrooxydans]APZ43949.1 Bcr/CflA family drug resistance efflux transporter [Acidihalobacter ferrooxydans]
MSTFPRTQIIVILGALSAFGSLSIDMYLPSLPTLQHDFATTQLGTQLTLAAFFIGFALGQAFVGPLSDRFGRKPPLVIGLALYVISSLGCAFAPSIDALTALRFIQGLGACSGVVIARAVVRDLFPAQETPHIFASLILVMGVAPVLAPLLGGYLLAFAGWQAIFWTLACIGTVILLASALRLPESHQPTAEHSLAFGAVFARYGKLLRERHYLGYTLITGISFSGMFAYIAGSPFVFIELYRVPAHDFGWFFGLNALGLVGASQFNRLLHRFIDTFGLLRIAVIVQTTAGVALLLTGATGAGGLTGVMIPLFVYIASIGLIAPNATALAMAPHARNAGSASALMGTLQFGIAAIAAVAVGSIHVHSALPMSAVIAACGVLALSVMVIMLKNVPRLA